MICRFELLRDKINLVTSLNLLPLKQKMNLKNDKEDVVNLLI